MVDREYNATGKTQPTMSQNTLLNSQECMGRQIKKKQNHIYIYIYIYDIKDITYKYV